MNPFTSKNLGTALSAVGVVIVLGGIYWYFFAGASTSATALSATSGGSESALFALTSQLANISFDTSIFADPRFASLKDISTPITPEPEGKADPFSPASP